MDHAADQAEHEHHEHCHREPVLGTILTVRAIAGLAGDMMLGGLAALAGLGDSDLDELVKELNLPALTGSLRIVPHSVNQIAGIACRIDLPHEHAHRNMADIGKLILNSGLPPEARDLSLKAFSLLAEAEGLVHGKEPDQVTFHEVGALDSILDICLVCRIFTLLAPDLFVCSPIPIADGVIHCAHGQIPSPAPAVLYLLRNVPVQGFPGQGETITPTALALLKALDADFGPWPRMLITETRISYGGKIFANAPNGAVWALGRGIRSEKFAL